MNDHKDDILAILRWFIPSSTQLAVCVFIVFFTAILCSQETVNGLFFSPNDFNPIRGIVSYIDTGLQNVAGEKVAGGLSLGIFWGTIGLLVNLVWWLGSSFSTELSNDLVFSKYVHPRGADKRAPIREFVIRALIRAITGILGLLYLNFVISNGLPTITDRFAMIFSNWSFGLQWKNLLATIFLELLMLHGLVVLTRVMLLRRPSNF